MIIKFAKVIKRTAEIYRSGWDYEMAKWIEYNKDNYSYRGIILFDQCQFIDEYEAYEQASKEFGITVEEDFFLRYHATVRLWEILDWVKYRLEKEQHENRLNDQQIGRGIRK